MSLTVQTLSTYLLASLFTVACLTSSPALARGQFSNAPGVPDDSFLYYRPSDAGSIAFFVIYLITAIGLFYQSISRRDWWSLCLPIGATCQAFGFVTRLPLARHPSSMTIYIIQYFLVVLSPACYLAFNYIAFGRLSFRLAKDDRFVDQDVKMRGGLTLVPSNRMGAFFITSDITTFLIQAAGGSMQTSQKLHDVGGNIFLAGIILQFISYVIFLMLVFLCYVRVGGLRPSSRMAISNRATKAGDDTGAIKTAKDLKTYFAVLAFSSVWIIVRSIYRIIELAQGYRGYLFIHEIFFFTLDSLPLILAILIYVPFWPSKFYPLKSFPANVAQVNLDDTKEEKSADEGTRGTFAV
ncbi:hypothetical protein IE53DRAFT_125310 [Violaceomyces palustris]|uniref:Uncharacterized protein n=1 Tax=Violaceomyces palustris TaxID=1673888 RepID=A0ACD0P6H4_9BASI|nr:hypothetical protein IE53DRAFT_125310 [Violaceomyces palustris]